VISLDRSRQELARRQLILTTALAASDAACKTGRVNERHFARYMNMQRLRQLFET
jgi:hypothetical protein